MSMFLQDLRFGLRLLARKPGFTAIAVATLALGIGANTAIFSIVNTVLLAPLPYPQPNRLLALHDSDKNFSFSSISYPDFLDWQRLNRSFTGIAAYRSDDSVLAGGHNQQPEHLATETVSTNFFQVLGVHLLHGPGLSPAEDRANGAPQVVISYSFWQRRFGGNPSLVGQAIPLNGKSYQVMGILPRDFWFRVQADVFTPLGQYMPLLLYDRGNHPGIVAVGRLRPGVTQAAAQADMSAVARALAREYPKDDGETGITVTAMNADMVRGVRSTLLLLFAAVGLVLLIACANVANLLLARATSRRREIAVRGALGAGGGRIVRQLLTESAVLGLAGGALGLLIAWLAVKAAPSLIPEALPRIHQVGLQPAVLGFTLAAALLSGLLFGSIPAWSAASDRLNLQDGLKEGARGATAGHHRTQNALAVAEIALALMLLAGAGLLIQTMVRLQRVNPGFETHHVLTLQVALSPSVLNNGPAIAAAHRALLERVNALPDVAAAAETTLIPLGPSDSEMGFWQGGKTQPPPDQVHSAVSFFTSPRWLEAMQIPLLSGRYLTAQDDLHHPFSVVIDQDFAHQYFAGKNPLGQHLQFPIIGQATVVGVVRHIRFWTLGDESHDILPEMYMAIGQIPPQYMTIAGQGINLIVRSRGDNPLGLLPEVRAAVAGPDRDQPVYGIQTMDQVIAASLAQGRFLMTLLGLFAAIALILAAIGIYGVLSYAVAQRTHEVGIRMALGARPGDVVAQMVAHGARLALLGVAIGIFAAVLTTRIFAKALYNLPPADPVTLTAVAALLLGIALLACYIPARRAAHVDPTIALRGE